MTPRIRAQRLLTSRTAIVLTEGDVGTSARLPLDKVQTFTLVRTDAGWKSAAFQNTKQNRFFLWILGLFERAARRKESLRREAARHDAVLAPGPAPLPAAHVDAVARDRDRRRGGRDADGRRRRRAPLRDGSVPVPRHESPDRAARQVRHRGRRRDRGSPDRRDRARAHAARHDRREPARARAPGDAGRGRRGHGVDARARARHHRRRHERADGVHSALDDRARPIPAAGRARPSRARSASSATRSLTSSTTRRARSAHGCGSATRAAA